MFNHSPRPKAELYLCYGKCGEWKPGSAFFKADNKSGLVYANLCRVCRKQAIRKWLGDYYQSLRDDPVKLMEAIEKFDQLKPKYDSNDSFWLSKFYKWMMAKNSLMARLGLIEKLPKFDPVEYFNRKADYGLITPEQAEKRIKSWYERHPDDKRVEY